MISIHRRLASAAWLVFIPLVPAAFGQPLFVDRTAERGIDFVQLYADPLPGYLPTETARYGTGAAASDYDRDGDLDLYVVNTYGNPSAFYRNDGHRFTDIADSLGLRFPGYGRMALFADLDDDGFDDLVVLCDTNGTPAYPFSRLYRNNGDGSFTDVSEGSGFTPLAVVLGGATAGDPDRDGDLDLYVSTWYDQRHYFYRNDGNFHFTDVTTSIGSLTSGASEWTPLFVDLDGDAWQDLFCAVDFDEDYVLRNDGRGGLRRVWPAEPYSFNNDMGVAAADFDDDGDIDLYTTNITELDSPPDCCNWLYVNDGHGGLRNEAPERGIVNSHWGWGTAFLDAELDGDLDIVAANGWVQKAWLQPPTFFVNDGTGHFTRGEIEAGLDRASSTRCLLPFDCDRDGDIDLLTVDWEGPATLWENTTVSPVPSDRRDEAAVRRAGAHYLTVQLEGVESNRNGVGARVRVDVGERTRLAEITCGGSFSAGPPLEAHFGLGSTAVVSVHVAWPSGRAQTIDSVAVDRVLVVREPEGGVVPPPAAPPPAFTAIPNPFRGSTVIYTPGDEAATLSIVDASGERVATLAANPDGTAWDGRTESGRRAAPGVYFIGPSGGDRRLRVVLLP